MCNSHCDHFRDLLSSTDSLEHGTKLVLHSKMPLLIRKLELQILNKIHRFQQPLLFFTVYP